ncbi:nuclear transport factor 2 family protein [Nesterenkonia sp. E16_7]|uniref:hypothetical protein n=1 Tax=unclassified Nesterenkonia TaxID=2629769 RepID=UPI001A929A8E|nr:MULTISPECIES: hypothetical protein [unclassified Nesterenkonia]MBO0594736.1 nuclear transport factor 2 family protein [Nesterenkonia sp. E16_10]MBO0597764.1 nuclear transport factor 2 family protein [Nesterenkonia sp. E16_7]
MPYSTIRRTELPAVVTAFLASDATSSPQATAELFTDQAVVLDDGRTYRGREAILGWRKGAARAFSYTKTMRSARQRGPLIEIVECLEGDFPGGRVDLRSTFTVEPAGLISSLRITVAD